MPAGKLAASSHLAFFENGPGRTRIEVKAGRMIFAQGSPADSLFFIVAGKVKLSTMSSQGKEAAVGILGAGDFVGEGCLAGQTVRIASVSTMTDSIVVRIEKAAMVRALQEEADFASMFIAYLLARHVRMESDLIDQLFNSSEKRLARLLLLLADSAPNSSAHQVVPKISQETLAEMIGATRSRVSHFLNKFRRLGFISYNGQIEVNAPLLKTVLEDGTTGQLPHHLFPIATTQ